MVPYSKIDRDFWLSKKGRKIVKFGPECIVTAMYLMVNDHLDYLGYYSIPLFVISNETRISENDIEKAMENLESIDFCEYDHDAEIVYVKKMALYQVGILKGEDKRIKGFWNKYEKLPESRLKAMFHADYKELYSTIEAPSKPLQRGTEAMNMNKNMSSNKNINKSKIKEKSKPKNSFLSQPIIDLFNDNLSEHLNEATPSDTLKSKLKARSKEYGYTIEDWAVYFESILGMPFLLGNVTDFKATLLWLTGKESMAKVLSGMYKGNSRSDIGGKFVVEHVAEPGIDPEKIKDDYAKKYGLGKYAKSN